MNISKLTVSTVIASFLIINMPTYSSFSPETEIVVSEPFDHNIFSGMMDRIGGTQYRERNNQIDLEEDSTEIQQNNNDILTPLINQRPSQNEHNEENTDIYTNTLTPLENQSNN